MALWLHVHGGYPSYAGLGIHWNDDDWRAYKMVKALKGEPFKGYADVRRPTGQPIRISETNPTGAFRVFGEWGAAKLQQLGLKGGWLVPVPSSTCLALGSDVKGRGLASAIAHRAPGFTVLEALCWGAALQKSSAGGPRDFDTLYANLRIQQKLPAGNIILVDDVITTGGHLLACAAGLRHFGGQVEHALCAAQTVPQQPTNMFAISSRNLE